MVLTLDKDVDKFTSRRTRAFAWLTLFNDSMLGAAELQNVYNWLTQMLSFSFLAMGGLFRFLTNSFTTILLALLAVHAEVVDPSRLDACPGYTATNVQVSGGTLRADLSLGLGQPCNVFGVDLPRLSLEVEYQTSE